MKNTIIIGLFFLTFDFLLLTFYSCDTAKADPYKEKYEHQVIVNDSLQAEINLLGERLDLIYTTSIRKIDSLKNVIYRQNSLITEQDSIINNSHRDFQVFLDSLEYDLEHLSNQALQNLINIQKR